MTPAMDFETDQKLKLLTDALRAGPGSPEWRQATAELRIAGAVEDEHAILLRVREHLAAGHSYREVRAGPAFTRKVIDGIENEEQSRPGMSPSANWIAAIAALVIVGVLAIVAFLIWPHAPQPPGPPSLDRISFVTTVESVSFDDSIGAEWQTFGNLQPLIADHGLKPVPPAETGGYRGGGVYWDRLIPADQPIAVDSTFTMEKSPGNVAVQLFVTDDRDFTGKTATTPHELVLLLKDQEAKTFLPDGSTQGQTARLKDLKQSVDVRVALNAKDAVVEVNQQRIFFGAHGLDPSKPRTVGVRFVVSNPRDADKIAVQSVRILEPEKTDGSSAGNP